MTKIGVQRQGRVAVVTIDLAGEFMTMETVLELDRATEALHRDQDCRAMVFTGGQEGVFIRHYDVGALEELSGGLRQKGMTFSAERIAPEREIDRLFQRLAETPKITIAAINGFAMGGGFEFCLACDLRIVQDGDFHLGLPEINIGLLPGAGGTQKLARLVGQARALEMVLAGRTVPPREALALGMVHEVVEGPVLARAVALAEHYAGKPAVAFAHIKRLIRQSADGPLADGLAMERTLFLDCLVSDEAHERMSRMNRRGLDIREVAAPD